MKGVDGYYDIVWADVNIEKINAELLEFQNKYVHGQILSHDAVQSDHYGT